MPVHPFTIDIPESVIADLRIRLEGTSFPDEISGAGWGHGADLCFMKEIVQYWRAEYDWFANQKVLNEFNHFKADIEGSRIHFIHERGKGEKPIPLIITHGWPGSFTEMLKIIPMLTDPVKFGGEKEESFDVVVPSLPGYGFSDKPRKPGMNAFRIADMWKKLMEELGYQRFGAQGGDWGASVSTCLGFKHAGNVLGVHLNYIPGSYRPYLGPETKPLSAQEKKFLDDADSWYVEEGGYAHIQRTKPQTLAYGLNDSPAALAAWIIEKFRDWSDCEGNIEKRFSRNELLTNVMIYWITETIHSSTRLYYEVKQRPLHFQSGDKMQIPCGIARFAKESPFPPREWIDRFYNVKHWTNFPQGGHFAAMEEPEFLVRDIRKFFKLLREK